MSTSPDKPSVDSASDARTVNNSFRHQYKVLSESEKLLMVALKDAGVEFFELLAQVEGAGREVALAKTKMEEAVMWAVKGITA